MDRAMILAKLSWIKPQLQSKYGLTEIALFGSYSRDEQTTQSDIDLMVDFENITYRNLFDCAVELENLFKGKKVQVVTRDGIKPRYFEAIKPDLRYA